MLDLHVLTRTLTIHDIMDLGVGDVLLRIACPAGNVSTGSADALVRTTQIVCSKDLSMPIARAHHDAWQLSKGDLRIWERKTLVDTCWHHFFG